MSGRMIAAVSALLTLIAAGEGRASPFDGSWRTDLSSLEFPARPELVVLKDGVYECRSCTPPYSLAADGVFHRVADDPSVDERRVDVVDSQSVRFVDRNADRISREVVVRVAPDGRSRTIAWSEFGGPGTPRIAGKTIQVRQDDPATEAHVISGSWQTVGLVDVTDAAMTETLKLENGILSMSRATGESYRAQIDGPPAPYAGNPAITHVLVTRAGPRELIEKSLYRGEVLTILYRSISADGRTQLLRAENVKTGSISAARSNKV